jgi:shikimate kinase
MNIVLVGFMGTGKSAAGKRLAARLGWRFADTDTLIEAAAGKTVTALFATDGEAHFRDLETQAVAQAGALDNTVLACGGGVVLRRENMETLARNGIVVCLTASPEAIFARVRHSHGRPLLAAADPLARIRELLAARAPFYRQCPVTIDTTGLGIDDVVEKIVRDRTVAERLGRDLRR